MRGEVRSSSPALGDNYVAELYSPVSHTVAASAYIANSGNFEFHDIRAGQYTLRIRTLYGQPVTELSVNAASDRGPIEVLLPEEKRARPVSGTVSVGELQHSVPKKALQAAAAAQRFSESGEVAKATVELEKAVRIDPEYADAHGNLGAQYAKAARYDEAVTEFETGLRLKPESSILHSNLASVFLATGQMNKAETAARRALVLDQGNLKASYVLGRILMTRVESRPEALRSLLRAEAEMPNARLAAAQIYSWQGDDRSAVEKLRGYLATDGSADRKRIEAIIRRLEEHSDVASSQK